MLEKAYGYLREEPDPRGCPRSEAAFRTSLARRLALLQPGPRLADHRLHVGGAQVRPGARRHDSRPRFPRELAAPESVQLILSWQARGRRLGDLREAARRCLARGAQSLAGLRRHHGRLLRPWSARALCLQALVAQPGTASTGIWGPPSRKRSAAVPASCARSKPAGRQLRGIVGVCFTYGTLVQGDRTSSCCRSLARRSGHHPGLRVSIEQATPEWRLGRGQSVLPGATQWVEGSGAAGGSNLLGAVDLSVGPSIRAHHRAAAGGRVSRRTSGAG